MRSSSPRISAAAAASRSPPGDSRTPPAARWKSGSPRSRRSDATAAETAGSVTPSAAAAALTEPSRATVANARSCVKVIAAAAL